MDIKARKVGHSITLTVPINIKVEIGQEFTVHTQPDGSIVFTPKHQNPFEGNWFNEDLAQTEALLEPDTEVLDSEWS
ncbi:type II toxin-antitoxin system PemI/MazE family antitoxin [Lacticaseibacillus mingshuiensis]|uniref:Type II toxin-antitoxin system PemI/MazE family antitoxin n=1 Tax=Lacticaseibacillus mingshuiensis TaxID=2799574 RepID=A0ABW4CKT8_9LACO|nr:AbrB/MazE/SpoVT family DNA-binding domain-containing protein [Lacticaseibacillus mingshuiensis]